MTEPLAERRAVSDAEVREVVERLLAGQRFGAALTAAVAGAVAGLLVWGAALHAIGWQDQWILQSWSCIAVVALVALVVRRVGRGIEPRFATLGGCLGVAVVLLGEVVAIRLDSSSFPGVLSFLRSRGFWDLALALVGFSIGSSIARTKISVDQVRARLSWHPESERERLAARYPR